MATFTPDEVSKLDRTSLESAFLRLQALAAAHKNRATVTRQRIALIEQHVSALKKHVFPAELRDGQ